MAKQGVEYLKSSSKRGIDVLGGLAISSGAAPFALPTAVLAAIDNRALLPLFEQIRLGQDGRPLTIRKFRTLRKDLTDGPERRYGPHDPRLLA